MRDRDYCNSNGEPFILLKKDKHLSHSTISMCNYKPITQQFYNQVKRSIQACTSRIASEEKVNSLNRLADSLINTINTRFDWDLEHYGEINFGKDDESDEDDQTVQQEDRNIEYNNEDDFFASGCEELSDSNDHSEQDSEIEIEEFEIERPMTQTSKKSYDNTFELNNEAVIANTTTRRQRILSENIRIELNRVVVIRSGYYTI